MNNSVKRRLTVYRQMEKYYCDHKKNCWPSGSIYMLDDRLTYCMCSLMKRVVPGFSCEWEDYPELLAQKPKKPWIGNSNFWWSPFGFESRLRAVRRAIDLCTAKITPENGPEKRKQGTVR